MITKIWAEIKEGKRMEKIWKNDNSEGMGREKENKREEEGRMIVTKAWGVRKEGKGRGDDK